MPPRERHAGDHGDLVPPPPGGGDEWESAPGRSPGLYLAADMIAALLDFKFTANQFRNSGLGPQIGSVTL
jgi:hypothetical protein